MVWLQKSKQQLFFSMTQEVPPEENQSLFSQPQYSNQNYHPATQGSGSGPGSGYTPLIQYPSKKTSDEEAPPFYPASYSSPQAQVNRNIIDLKIPKGLECEIDRDTLLATPISVYTRDVFVADNAKIYRCLDYLVALIGPAGIVLVVLGILLIVTSGSNQARIPEMGLSLVVFGALFIGVYTATFIKPVFQSCCGSGDQFAAERMISGSFARATFQRRTSDLDSVKASINSCQNDIPQLLVTVICSHEETQGYLTKDDVDSDSDPRAQFRATYSLPIASYRFLGPSEGQFLSAVDDIHSGDCTIEFLPDLITVPEQKEYLQEFVSAIYAANKDKAKYCKIFARFVCGQYDSSGIYTRPKMAEELSVYYEQNEGKKQGKGDFVLRQTFVSTSLGSRTEFYQANGKSANSLLRCLASPFMWFIGATSCLFVFFIPFFQCRWKHLTYHSAFQVLFPKMEQILEQFQQDSNTFLVQPPEIINGATATKPWDV